MLRVWNISCPCWESQCGLRKANTDPTLNPPQNRTEQRVGNGTGVRVDRFFLKKERNTPSFSNLSPASVVSRTPLTLTIHLSESHCLTLTLCIAPSPYLSVTLHPSISLSPSLSLSLSPTMWVIIKGWDRGEYKLSFCLCLGRMRNISGYFQTGFTQYRQNTADLSSGGVL